MKSTIASAAIPKNISHTAAVRFTDDGRLEIFNQRLANKINRHLKYYENGDYKFRKGEEAIFRVPTGQILEIKQLLNRKQGGNA